MGAEFSALMVDAIVAEWSALPGNGGDLDVVTAHVAEVLDIVCQREARPALVATVGDAQHHSSRTVEELFARVGYTASETHDFDPSGYPADMVVELWEVRAR